MPAHDRLKSVLTILWNTHFALVVLLRADLSVRRRGYASCV